MTQVIKFIPDIELFKAAMITVLGEPKNVAKQHPSTISRVEMFRLIELNHKELILSIGDDSGQEIQDRTVDIANLCMMLWNNIERAR